MCGIVGIVSQSPINESIYAALTLLQHRGQDAAGIVTVDDENRFRLRKANGLVSDVFHQEMLDWGMFAILQRGVLASQRHSLFM